MDTFCNIVGYVVGGGDINKHDASSDGILFLYFDHLSPLMLVVKMILSIINIDITAVQIIIFTNICEICEGVVFSMSQLYLSVYF